MKYFSEKEKKLGIALDKLKKLNLLEEEGQKNLEFLSNQKNQLEIEKKELEQRYSSLQQENQKLKHKFDDFKKKEIEEKKREDQFSH